jgi:hypothetical protein
MPAIIAELVWVSRKQTDRQDIKGNDWHSSESSQSSPQPSLRRSVGAGFSISMDQFGFDVKEKIFVPKQTEQNFMAHSSMIFEMLWLHSPKADSDGLSTCSVDCVETLPNGHDGC